MKNERECGMSLTRSLLASQSSSPELDTSGNGSLGLGERPKLRAASDAVQAGQPTGIDLMSVLNMDVTIGVLFGWFA